MIVILAKTKIVNKSAEKIVKESTEKLVETTSETESDMEVLESGANHKIYELTENGKPQYKYEIYNADGKTVDTGTVERMEPFFEYYSDKLLSISFSGGTGRCFMQTRFYDIEADKFSEDYWAVLTVDDHRVVYMDDDTRKLVVRDIFDKAKYSKEFKLDINSSSIASNLINEVEFLGDSEIKVTYLSGEDYDEKETTLQLD